MTASPSIQCECHQVSRCCCAYSLALILLLAITPTAYSQDITFQLVSCELETPYATAPHGDFNTSATLGVDNSADELLSLNTSSSGLPHSGDRLLQQDRPIIHALHTADTHPKEHKNTGFLDFNFYPYTVVDKDNSVTVNALANLPHGFQYFSLTNYERDPTRYELEEIKTVLTEQNLRWQIPGGVPWAIAAQALIRTGDNNDAFRLGPRVALHEVSRLQQLLESWGLKYWIAFYGAQFDNADGYQWQMEHVFRWNVFPELFDNRVYVGGFADHNVDHRNGTDSIWLEEAQLGVRLFSEWYVVAEQRYNGFRNHDESSLGLGFEYVVRFK